MVAALTFVGAAATGEERDHGQAGANFLKPLHVARRRSLAFGARLVLCGSISEYTRDEPFGLTNITRLRSVNGTMRGFFVYHHLHQWTEAMDQMAGWIHDGRLRPVQDVLTGFQRMPEALSRLYDGGNTGVQCCDVRGEPAEFTAQG